MVNNTMRPITILAFTLLATACHNQPDAQEPASTPAEDASAENESPPRELPSVDTPAEKPLAAAPVPEVDKTFALEAAKGGIAEVELSKVALAGVKKPAIKELAQRMIDDHTKANAELTALVGARGVDLPKDPDQATTDRMTALAKLKGTKLEKAYLDHMLADHRKAVELFRTQTTSGADPEIKDWATRTLPKLEEHLGHTEAVASGKKHEVKEVAVASPAGTR